MSARESMPGESPFARLKRSGLRSASPADLLALSLSPGPDQAEAAQAAALGWMRSHRIRDVLGWSAEEVRQLGGLGEYEAWRLLAVLELGRRAALAGKGLVETIHGPEDLAELFADLQDEPQEHFCAVAVNVKNGVLGVKTVHIGTADSAPVWPRDVFREAIRLGAAGVFVVHNHPSGDPEPSAADYAVTDRLVAIGELLQIPLLDHVIVGHGRFVSLRQRKRL